jgi:hypothetical protein
MLLKLLLLLSALLTGLAGAGAGGRSADPPQIQHGAAVAAVEILADSGSHVLRNGQSLISAEVGGSVARPLLAPAARPLIRADSPRGERRLE